MKIHAPNNAQKTKLKSMALVVAVTTTLFLLLSSPVAIAGGYFITLLRSTENLEAQKMVWHGYLFLIF